MVIGGVSSGSLLLNVEIAIFPVCAHMCVSLCMNMSGVFIRIFLNLFLKGHQLCWITAHTKNPNLT
jgi:hypothetical protein